VNAGTTWKPIFDDYGSASIGDIALFQKDPNIIWVGTGEANNRNSVSWGDGVYKSEDGGRTFQRVGLEDTFQIARIATHPTNPRIAYVAAIGYLWGYSGDRGLFRTSDGGVTWEQLTNGLPNDGRTGATELVMDPRNPEVLYVAFYERLRKPYRFDSGGPNGGIFKSEDGGDSWKKLTQGLPEGDTGRIGLAVYRKNPKILMAILEHGFQPSSDDPDYSDLTKLGSGVYRSEDGGETWEYLNRHNNRPFYYSQIRINPGDDQLVYTLASIFRISRDGGRTFEPGGSSFGRAFDYHAMWFDPNQKDRYYLGADKGMWLTHDHGENFLFYGNLPVGQFYAIGVDMREPYYVYGGTQDNGTWGGPSFSRDARGVLNDEFWKLHWGDGMFVQVDPRDWRKVFTEAENGSIRLYDALTRRVEFRRPSPSNIVNYTDYAQAPTPDEPDRLPRELFRFNWRSPMIMSPHNPDILYLGGNHLFMTVNQGKAWRIISPDLSTNDPVKTDRNSGGLTRDTSGAETHCTITALSESPLVPGLLWAGTDDGRVHVSSNGGQNWDDVTDHVPAPEGLWVSSLEASHHQKGTAYLTVDGHRSDNRSTLVFKTEDFGRSWKSLHENLPDSHPAQVIKEDSVNPDLLFLGTEFSLHVSLDGGQGWQRLMNGMPTVAVYDLVIHPRDGALIAGTHGRGIWIMDDITPLRQLTAEAWEADVHLFQPRPQVLWEDASRGGQMGQAYFAGENPVSVQPSSPVPARAMVRNTAILHFYVRESVSDGVSIEISDLAATKSHRAEASGEAGIHQYRWDLRFDPEEEESRSRQPRVGPGKYLVRLTAGEVTQSIVLTLRADPLDK
jgi:photosystem II stability/assembly factor-like uncharacterized protein